MGNSVSSIPSPVLVGEFILRTPGLELVKKTNFAITYDEPFSLPNGVLKYTVIITSIKKGGSEYTTTTDYIRGTSRFLILYERLTKHFVPDFEKIKRFEILILEARAIVVA